MLHQQRMIRALRGSPSKTHLRIWWRFRRSGPRLESALCPTQELQVSVIPSDLQCISGFCSWLSAVHHSSSSTWSHFQKTCHSFSVLCGWQPSSTSLPSPMPPLHHSASQIASVNLNHGLVKPFLHWTPTKLNLFLLTPSLPYLDEVASS